MATEHRLVAHDGTPLFYRRVAAEAERRAAAVLVHGMGEHGGRYLPLAESLAGLGIESAVPDLRGMGQSGGKRGCVRSFADLHEDLAAVHRLLLKQLPRETPLFFLGHSFGGLVTSSYVAFRQAPKPRGLALTSPIFGIAIPVPAWRHALGIVTSYLAPDYTQSSRVDARVLTHDPEMLGRYGADGLIHHRISSRLYRELVRMIARSEAIAARLRIPLLVLQAGEDHIVSREAAVRFFERAASTDKELEIFEGWYHEILNETDRARVFTRIGAWMIKQTLQLPHNK